MLDILTLEFQQLPWTELVARRWLFLPSCFFSFGLAVICLPSLKDLSTGRIKWKALPKQKGWRIINGQRLEVPSGSYYGLGSMPFFLEVPGFCHGLSLQFAGGRCLLASSPSAWLDFPFAVFAKLLFFSFSADCSFFNRPQASPFPIQENHLCVIVLLKLAKVLYKCCQKILLSNCCAFTWSTLIHCRQVSQLVDKLPGRGSSRYWEGV